ncbi:MAG TPA: alpha/beta hydrolase [Streptosporangiaceae bacterium]|nr:alpha/beta hydrolase [Streptosporangiaceae bacterium]
MTVADWERLQTTDIETNGITLRVTEHGTGPAVVLCHGFPELAFSWRHQVFALAKAGYRVLAPDMRGYGGSSRPDDPAGYVMPALCDDLAGLLDAAGERDAVFVGHDWGAAVVWHLALLHPDRVRAVAGLSVPASPRSPAPPIPILRQRFGDDFYMIRFQAPGEAEKLLSADVTASMTAVLAGTSFIGWPAVADPRPLPPWISEDELAVYVRAFERTGFTGGLNYYRAMDLSWERTADLDGKLVTQPALFLTGESDPVRRFLPGTSMAGIVPDLREQVVLPGAGHWVQQERPAEVNAELLRFLSSV